MLQSDNGINFNILLLRIFIILKLLHRRPSLGSLTWRNQKQNLLINHLSIIFKHCLDTSMENGTVCFANLKLYLIKVKTIEQNISPCSSQKKNSKEIESYRKYSEINM